MGGKVLDLDINRAHDAGINEGITIGSEDTKTTDIRNLMKNLKMTAEQAMEAIGIPKSDYNKYLTML